MDPAGHLLGRGAVRPQAQRCVALLDFGVGQRPTTSRCRRKTEPATVPDGFLAAAAAKRLLVKPSKKVFIRRQLESLGLTQASIFPEIDKVAEFIKRTYPTLPFTSLTDSK